MLLERTRDGGRKILISGGGRCNILPARVDERRFVTDSSPHTLRNILRSWPLAEQIAFFERELGLPLVEEAESAKLFPASNRARDVRDGLLALAARRGARFVPDTTGHRPRSRATAAGGSLAEARRAARGGRGDRRDRRALGAEHRQRRHRARDPRGAGAHGAPDLRRRSRRSPTPAGAFASLAGVSLPVTITARSDGRQAVGAPAASCSPITATAARRCSTCRTCCALARRGPSGTPRGSGAGGRRSTRTGGRARCGPRAREPSAACSARELPERLADALLAAGRRRPGDRRWRSSAGRSGRRLIEMLVRGELPWTGDEGYRKAEVTGGGVSLAEVDPRTMESRRHARTLHLRRGARRVRPDRRLQLPLGLGDGAGGRTGRGPRI